MMAGCNPYEFRMGGPHVTTCEILTSLPGVDHTGMTATLVDTAAIDMNYFGATQYLITMGITLQQGSGYRILLRPVVEARDVKDSGIVVIATRSGISLEQGGHVIVSRPDLMIAPNDPVRVALFSENNYMQVVFNCDTVFRGWTKLKESDDVVVQALEKSQVEIIHPDWAAPPDQQ